MNDQTNAAQRSRATFLKVELLKDHEHAGQPHKAGALLDLDTDTARWLIEQGVARSAATEPKPRKQQED